MADYRTVMGLLVEDKYDQALSIMRSRPLYVDQQQFFVDFIQDIFQVKVECTSSPMQLCDTLAQLLQRIPRATCGCLLDSDLGVTCETCSNDPNAIYCLACFEQEKHIGHQYQFKEANGMCDCGFKFSMLESSFCGKHYGAHVTKSLRELSFGKINLAYAAHYVYFIFTSYICQFRNGNEEFCMIMAQLMKQLIYDIPSDCIKKITTHYLFMRLADIHSSDSLLQDYTIEQLIPPYHELYNIKSIQDVTDTMTNIIVYGKLNQFDNFQLTTHVTTVTASIVRMQMSDASYRAVLLYYYYMHYNTLESHLTYNKTIQKQKNDIIWIDALCQICSNIHIDNTHTILLGVAQYSCFIQVQSLYHEGQPLDECYQKILDDQYLLWARQGLQKFEALCPSQKDQLQDFIWQNFSRVLPLIKQYHESSEDSDIRTMGLMINLHYKCLSDVYSFNNIRFVAVLMSNPLTSLLFLCSHFYFSTTYLRRYRDRDAIEDTTQLANYMHYISVCYLRFYQYAWSVFVAAILGEDYDPFIDHQQEIKRTTDDIAYDGQDTSKQILIINNVLSQSLYLLLCQATKNKNMFMYSTNNHVPQAATAHGIHTYNSVIGTDVDQPQETYHMVGSTNLINMCFMLNAYQIVYKERNVAEYLDGVLNTLVYTNQRQKYNLYTITTINIRCLVTAALFSSNCFIKLTDRVFEFVGRYYSNSYNFYGGQTYYSIYNLQILALCYLKHGRLEHFIYQFVEAFGFLDAIKNKYVDRISAPKDPEDHQKMHKVLQKMINYLTCIVLRDQRIRSMKDYKVKAILQYFMKQLNPTEIQLNTYIEDYRFSNQHQQNKYYNEVATLVQQQAMSQTEAYQSHTKPCYYYLNRYGLQQVSILDPFFQTVPSFLYNYQNYCQQNKMEGHHLPCDIDRYDDRNCFNMELSRQVFTHEAVQLAVCQVIELFVQQQSSIRQQTQDILVCLIAFKQVVLHSGDNSLVLWTLNKLLASIKANVFEDSVQHAVSLLFGKYVPNVPGSAEGSNLERLKSKLAQFKNKDHHDTEEQNRLMETAAVNSVEKEEDVLCHVDPELLNLLVAANENTYVCSVCIYAQPDVSLCQYCYIQEDYIVKRMLHHNAPPAAHSDTIMGMVFARDCCADEVLAVRMAQLHNFYIRTCGHLVHKHCNRSTYRMCTICRQRTNVLLPVVDDKSIASKEVLTFLAYLIQREESLMDEEEEEREEAEVLEGVQLVLSGDNNREQHKSAAAVSHRAYLLLCAVAVWNMRAFQIRMGSDMALAPSERDRKYQECMSVTCGILLLLGQFHKLPGGWDTMRSKTRPQRLDTISAGSNWLLMCVFAQIVAGNFSPAELDDVGSAETGRFVVQLCELYQHSRYDGKREAEISQLFESGYWRLLQSQSAYLVAEVSDGSQLYQLVRMHARAEYLAGLHNCFTIRHNSVPPYDLRNFFGTSFIEMIKNVARDNKCCVCNQNQPHGRVLVCLSCGTDYCYKCFKKNTIDEHRECNCVCCYYLPIKNLVLFFYKTSFTPMVIFTGGPYLDGNNEDDVERIKRVPLYLNGLLLSKLQHHINWDMTYKADPSQARTIYQILDYIKKQSR